MNRLSLQPLYGRAFVMAMCLVPVISVIMPRFTGIGPPLIALVFTLFHYAAFRRLPSFTWKFFIWALTFPALMALSSLWSVTPDASLERAVKIIPVMLSGAVLWDLGRTLERDAALSFRKYFPFAVLLSAAICFIDMFGNAALYQLFHSNEFPGKKFNYSRLNRSIIVLLFACVPAFFCLQHGQFSKRAKNIFMIVLGFLFIAVLAASESLSAQLAFVLMLIFYFLFPYGKKWAWGLLTALIAFGTIAAPWLAQWMFIFLPPLMPHSAVMKNSYANIRLEIWDYVSRRILENPLYGFGAEATRGIEDFQAANIYIKTAKILHPHNYALQLWIEFGIIGVIIGLIFLNNLLRTLQKLDIRYSRYLLPLFIAIMLIASTAYGLWQGWWIGMFCLLFGYAALMMNEDPGKTRARG